MYVSGYSGLFTSLSLVALAGAYLAYQFKDTRPSVRAV
jgi:hypothetical protein